MRQLIKKYGYRIKNRSILAKFFLYFITLVSLIILLSYVIYFFSISKYFMDEIASNNEQILKQAVSTYEVFLDSTIKAAMVNMKQDKSDSVFMNDDGFYNNDIIYNNLNDILKISSFIHSAYYFKKAPENVYIFIRL